MVSGKFLPLPYFLLDEELTILDYSRPASDIFLIGDNFITLVDEENRQTSQPVYTASFFRNKNRT